MLYPYGAPMSTTALQDDWYEPAYLQTIETLSDLRPDVVETGVLDSRGQMIYRSLDPVGFRARTLPLYLIDE